MYVCMYVGMYVCMYVYTCMCVCIHVCTYVCMYVLRKDGCMHVCMYACIISMYVPVCCPSVRSSIPLSLFIFPCLFVCISFYPTIRLLVCHCVILSVSLSGTDQCGPNREVFLSSFTNRPIALPILLLTMHQDLLLVQGFLTLLLCHGPL